MLCEVLGRKKGMAASVNSGGERKRRGRDRVRVRTEAVNPEMRT